MKKLLIIAVLSVFAFGEIAPIANAATASSTNSRIDRLNNQIKKIEDKINQIKYNSQTPTSSLTCITTISDKRETAVKTAATNSFASLTNAFIKRYSALKAAWQIVDRGQRRIAIDKAWSDFKNDVSAAKKIFRLEVKKAWVIYNSEKKTCDYIKNDEDNQREFDEGLF